MIRSPAEMKEERTLSSVVLPLPLAPATTMLSRSRTHWRRKSSASCVMLWRRTSSSGVRTTARNFLIGESSVDHRRGFVAASADGGDDPLDQTQDVVVVGERDVGEVEAPVALEPHVARAVHHDLGHRLIPKEVVDRPIAGGLREDGFLYPDAIRSAEKELLVIQRGGHMLGEEQPDRLRRRRLDPAADDRGDTRMDPSHQRDLVAAAQPAQLDRARPEALERLGGLDSGVGLDRHAHRLRSVGRHESHQIAEPGRVLYARTTIEQRDAGVERSRHRRPLTRDRQSDLAAEGPLDIGERHARTRRPSIQYDLRSAVAQIGSDRHHPLDVAKGGQLRRGDKQNAICHTQRDRGDVIE